MEHRKRLVAGLAGVFAVVILALNADSPSPPKEKQQWKTGYWLWAGSPPAPAGFKPDILYVEAPGRQWPRDVPAADEYVVVRRIEPGDRLTWERASALAGDYKALVAGAGDGVSIAGLQIDYDSPTGELESYGRFLKQLREDLPADSRLSITALLDWFRPRTAVAAALKWVDEFVPQFYDAGPARASAGIAEPVDAVKWAPVFNTYGVPYRVGIATFGRIARRRLDGAGRRNIQYFRDASPLDFTGKPQLARSAHGATETAAGELVVHYEVVAPIPDMTELRAGDAVDITFPTEASVRAAYEAVSQFGGYCAGSIFFRWPGKSETLALAPDDVRSIVSGDALAAYPKLEIRGASCIERQCADLYLDVGSGIHSSDRTIGIRPIGRVELFLPGGPLRSRASVTNQIIVNVPAYAGLGKFYLGRTFSRGSGQFEVIEP